MTNKISKDNARAVLAGISEMVLEDGYALSPQRLSEKLTEWEKQDGAVRNYGAMIFGITLMMRGIQSGKSLTLSKIWLKEHADFYFQLYASALLNPDTEVLRVIAECGPQPTEAMC